MNSQTRKLSPIWGGGIEGGKSSQSPWAFLSLKAPHYGSVETERAQEAQPCCIQCPACPPPLLRRAGGEQRCHLLEQGSSPWILSVACRVSWDRLQVLSREGGGAGHMEPDDRIWQWKLHRWACLCPDTTGGQGLNHLSSNFLFPNTSFEECGDALSRYQKPCWE